MIINQKPLALADVKEHIKDVDEKSPIIDYVRKFAKLSKEKAEKLADEIRSLNNLKIKEEDIIKIVDFLPQDALELNSIFSDVSLSEEEINALLQIVKKY